MRMTLWITVLILLLTFTVSTGPVVATGEGRFDSLKRFSQVLDLVERYYVEDVERSDLIDGAIGGMLKNLDPHSEYMNKDKYDDLQISTSGEFSGVGIEISLSNGRLVVISPIEDTPAYKAGMLAGDLILEIDGTSTQDISLEGAVKQIRGPKGSTVTLTVLHKNAQRPEKIDIVRDTIPIISVRGEVLDDGIGYVRVVKFNEKTTDELEKTLAKIRPKSGAFDGLVLDLRNNPGGLLDQAVSVSDAFLDEGMVVYIKDKDPRSRRDFLARSSESDITCPMVVLINAGSASASEIVAGALQDHKRALLVGERSFGKGSVQTIIPLPDGTGVKLTTALYYTPSGRSIQAEGIRPDLEVPFQPPAAKEKGRDDLGGIMRERDLSGHLENANGSSEEKHANGSEKVGLMLERDNQLRLALELVKSLPKIKALQ